MRIKNIFKLNKKSKEFDELKQIKASDIKNLCFGMMHVTYGKKDGVSIVMNQIERVLIKYLEVQKEHIFYLVGDNLHKQSTRVTKKKILGRRGAGTKIFLKDYSTGLSIGHESVLEKEIIQAERVISRFVRKNKIDVIIAHNMSIPISVVFSVALARYYQKQIEKNKQTPKYMLWWHDSHLERDFYQNPASSIKKYLWEGVPGQYIEHIFYINSFQHKNALKYFNKIDKKLNKKFFKSVVHNTTDLYANNLEGLQSKENSKKVEFFLHDYKIQQLAEKHQVDFKKDIIFSLQHTRILRRKRIDFALKFNFELLKKINQKKKKQETKKILYFLISGCDEDNDGTKKELKRLHKKYISEYKEIVCLVFADDYEQQTKLKFSEYPIIFSLLNGYATFFSEIEGFGNNLLEVMAAGLIPAIYKYPAYETDIKKYRFKLIALNKFEIKDKYLIELIKILEDPERKNKFINNNLFVLKERLNHKVITKKIESAILERRDHR